MPLNCTMKNGQKGKFYVMFTTIKTFTTINKPSVSPHCLQSCNTKACAPSPSGSMSAHLFWPLLLPDPELRPHYCHLSGQELKQCSASSGVSNALPFSSVILDSHPLPVFLVLLMDIQLDKSKHRIVGY